MASDFLSVIQPSDPKQRENTAARTLPDLAC